MRKAGCSRNELLRAGKLNLEMQLFAQQAGYYKQNPYFCMGMVDAVPIIHYLEKSIT
ncbi:MAG: hypothetical protein ACLTGI_03325 [Hoylesella buccalis]